MSNPLPLGPLGLGHQLARVLALPHSSLRRAIDFTRSHRCASWGGRFKGGEALAGTRGSKDEFPPVTAWQNVKLFHCLALFLKGFEHIRQEPFRAGDKVKMYASRGVLVPARVIAVHPGVGGQQTMYAVETKNFPGSGVVGPMVIRDGSNAVKEHRLRYARPDLSRNEQWVEFVCTTCGFHGGSREVGKNVCS
mgnify:CR=1 FL=1